jgi:magnesium chelatase family protein
VPRENADEVSFVAGARVCSASHLLDVHDALEGKSTLARVAARGMSPSAAPARDLSDVRGQELPKRALTIAAAGRHNLLMIGPPGSGKSMLAERMRGLLPDLDQADMLCVASIASVAGDRLAWKRGTAPPFRAPHHSTSMLALVGGGARPKPGEVSLAHRGVLFLDELPEFSRSALEALREPIETGVVQISRLRERVVYPAEFQLLAAMNPCPCGHHGDGTDRCSCSITRIGGYRAKISGPLLDRFDLHVEVPPVRFESLTAAAQGGETETLRETVADARRRQLDERGVLNARLEDAALWNSGRLTGEGRRLLRRAAQEWNLSARSTVRILRVARTIADLEPSSSVEARHLAEALQLRYLDRSA